MVKIVAHSIRLPEPLHKVLKKRAVINKRSFNGEMLYLLERAINVSVEADENAAKSLLSGHSTTG